MRIRFLSRNKYKLAEAGAILNPIGVEIVPVTFPIEELQTDNIEALIRDKALRAFDKLGHRLFVEQTGLFLDSLNGFPGGLTQPFWDRLEAERFSQLFGQGDVTGVTARTWIGYCDGRRIHQFDGEIRGRIASKPKGDPGFQWDCVFIPDGYNETFAEMGEHKNKISMRRIALDRLATHLKGQVDA